MAIKTFRGLMTDGDVRQIRLRTIDGEIGYKMRSFRLMAFEPGADNYEAIVKVYSVPQATATASIDFSDLTLLGAGFFTGDTTQQTMKWDTTIVTDAIFNQDIYVTYNDLQGSDAQMNFQIRLEQLLLTDNQNTVATLRNLKNSLPQHG